MIVWRYAIGWGLFVPLQMTKELEQIKGKNSMQDHLGSRAVNLTPSTYGQQVICQDLGNVDKARTEMQGVIWVL